jgi:hypothetical protein
MPHDKNGNPLSVGDKVLVRAEITSVSQGEDYCNVSAVTLEPIYPGEAKTSLTLNAKQVERIGGPEGSLESVDERLTEIARSARR